MTQQYPPAAPQKRRGGCAVSVIACAVCIVVALIAIVVIAASGGKSNSGATASTPSAAVPAGHPQTAATVEAQFRAFVAKHGTPNDIAAVKHVTKIQGANGDGNLVSLANIYTDYTGDITGPHSGSATLIASVFADFQTSRGKDNKNGLVTVYAADGTPLGNGNY